MSKSARLLLPAEQEMYDYPELEQNDIRQCIEYAAWLASERTISVAGLKR